MNQPVLLPITKLGYRRPEAAEFVGVSPTTFDRWVEEGKMPKARRIGGVVLWRADELIEAFNRLTGVEAGSLDVPTSGWSGRL